MNAFWLSPVICSRRRFIRLIPVATTTLHVYEQSIMIVSVAAKRIGATRRHLLSSKVVTTKSLFLTTASPYVITTTAFERACISVHVLSGLSHNTASSDDHDNLNKEPLNECQYAAAHLCYIARTILSSIDLAQAGVHQ